MNRIPVGAPDPSGNEEKYVVDAIRSSWISSRQITLSNIAEKHFDILKPSLQEKKV